MMPFASLKNCTKNMGSSYGSGRMTCRWLTQRRFKRSTVLAQNVTKQLALHEKRRRVWSGAFGEKNLRDYETRMVRSRALLMQAIDKSGNQPFDISKLFSLFTFDVMGDLAFGASFGMLETSKEHGAITLLHKAFAPVGFMLPAWLFRFMTEVPGLAKDWWGFINYCGEQVEKRIQMKSNTTDIMSSLLKPLNNQTPRLGDYLPGDLKDLDHLNGVINEALRLCPPVPSSVPRETPSEGLTIDDPDCFLSPKEFIPERWYSRPDLMPDASVFAPFSLGTYGCIGKPLALLNLRATVARIVADYDVQLAPEMSLEVYDQAMREHFTLVPSSLKVCFGKRV
ncbi:Cytochrome P450 [Penicillium herquei]|nr:Cytochrome P450 [Penicillium herquei]